MDQPDLHGELGYPVGRSTQTASPAFAGEPVFRDYLQADETRMQVLREKGKTTSPKSGCG